MNQILAPNIFSIMPWSVDAIGFELAGIVQGGTPEDAERRFYDHYRSARPRNLVVQPFSASSSQSTREPGVIGLFPDIRGFR